MIPGSRPSLAGVFLSPCKRCEVMVNEMLRGMENGSPIYCLMYAVARADLLLRPWMTTTIT